VSVAPAYRYAATVVRVIDGDTLELSVDVGFRFTHRGPFRLYGINCPEMNTDEGKAAQVWTNNWCDARGRAVIADTYRNPEKYGRWLVRVLDPSTEECLNDALVEAGQAEVYRQVAAEA
jgi:micrococcal nuclease